MNTRKILQIIGLNFSELQLMVTVSNVLTRVLNSSILLEEKMRQVTSSGRLYIVSSIHLGHGECTHHFYAASWDSFPRINPTTFFFFQRIRLGEDRWGYPCSNTDNAK